MTVMVDELRAWPGKASGQAARHFGSGKESCHLTCDGDLDELHAFAARIGLKRAWFQEHSTAPHYDLTPNRREAAMTAGAVFVSARQQARDRLETRRDIEESMRRSMTGER